MACKKPAAICEDIAAWAGGNGGGSDSSEPGNPSTDVPPTDAVPAGSGGGSETPAPEPGADPLPPHEGGGEVIVETNPIGDCVDAVFMSWFDGALPAAKQAVCDAVPANVDRCDDGGSVTVSSGSGEASSGSTPSGNASDSGGADPAQPAQIPAEDPMPPDEQPAPSYSEEDAAECRAFGALLSQQAFARLGACDAMADCDARDACLAQVLVCAPFIEVIYFGGGSATVSVDVVEPSSTDASGGSAGSNNTDPDPIPR